MTHAREANICNGQNLYFISGEKQFRGKQFLAGNGQINLKRIWLESILFALCICYFLNYHNKLHPHFIKMISSVANLIAPLDRTQFFCVIGRVGDVWKNFSNFWTAKNSKKKCWTWKKKFFTFFLNFIIRVVYNGYLGPTVNSFPTKSALVTG